MANKKITEEEVLGKATQSQETEPVEAPVEVTEPVAEEPTVAPETTSVVKKGEKMVTIFIPKRPEEKEDATEYLCVNGEAIYVQKDVEVQVPARFAEAWRNTKVAKDPKVAEMEAKAKSKVLTA